MKWIIKQRYFKLFKDNAIFKCIYTHTHSTYKNTLTFLLVEIEAWIFTKHTNKEFLGQNFSVFLVKTQTLSSYRHTHTKTQFLLLFSLMSLSPPMTSLSSLYLLHLFIVLLLQLMQKYDCESFFGKSILLAYVLKMIE